MRITHIMYMPAMVCGSVDAPLAAIIVLKVAWADKTSTTIGEKGTDKRRLAVKIFTGAMIHNHASNYCNVNSVSHVNARREHSDFGYMG